MNLIASQILKHACVTQLLFDDFKGLEKTFLSPEILVSFAEILE